MVQRHHADREGRPAPARATTWRGERTCRTAAEAAAFLRRCRTVGASLTGLFQLLIATGMREGEALAPRWADADLDHRLLFVRHTLGAR
ncbi:hypothetical protein Drose_25420 [Dactylosporangium roseum]|uniref:Tyr recombinase domain-containing protein n=1 Tax=Dactylosporangium roseum TaxID=47989 RepID=A0ABY5YZ99_9ACTN|nr:hypothetical protein [Dactylosporangium roseum]UWZ34552.1 hypothetical protein Drose_25420 [Dactylosporangium roseum]